MGECSLAPLTISGVDVSVQSGGVLSASNCNNHTMNLVHVVWEGNNRT